MSSALSSSARVRGLEGTTPEKLAEVLLDLSGGKTGPYRETGKEAQCPGAAQLAEEVFVAGQVGIAELHVQAIEGPGALLCQVLEGTLRLP